jgi:cell division protein YceG involved in septum cleavage
MKSRNVLSSIFSIFIILALVLDAQQEAFAYHGYALNNEPVIKAADSTLTIHDDFEVEKIYKQISSRKRIKRQLRVNWAVQF